jgi:hypothetical protein
MIGCNPALGCECYGLREQNPWPGIDITNQNLMKYWIGVEKMPEIEQAFRRNENFVFRQIDDETILVPIKNNVGDMGSIYNLNEVGAFVWEHLDGANTLLDIKTMVAEEFEVVPEDAERDLVEFIGQLEQIEAVFVMPGVK